MDGKYALSKNSDGRFLFNLKAGNDEKILTSESYDAKASAEKGIESVRSNASNDERFDRMTSNDKKPYFVLKGANGEVIGTSEQYSSDAAMEDGIKAVKANAPSMTVDDRTQLL
jgi:uncharacterized protein YegP (UPF0339 family)